MSKLPRISGRQCMAALLRAGFMFKRQEGSHMILRREQPFAQVPAYDHRKRECIQIWGEKMWEGIKLAAERLSTLARAA